MSIRTFRFELVSPAAAGPPFAVQLTTDGGQHATAPFQFDLGDFSRLTQTIAAMSNGIVTYDQLQDIGSNLFKGLVNGPVAELFASARADAEQREAAQSDARDPLQFALRLTLPPTLRHLPWECLYEEERGFGFLLNRTRYSLIREVPSGAPARPPRNRSRARMLVVIPQGAGLNVEKELHGLQLAVDRVDDVVELAVLDGHVTPDRFRERVGQGPWDIVHFIGHGDFVNGEARVRLNSDDPAADQWINGEVFATFFEQYLPDLVVLNSCLGGSEASLRSLAGVGPYLRRAGVPAVVAMQYEIPDTIAIKFAGKFYSELLTGTSAGRIDRALSASRLALYQNQTQDRPQSFMTPVLYLASGAEQLLELQRAPAAAAVAATTVAAPRVELPTDLLDAFRNGRIVPIIGAELLSVGAMRSADVAPSPGDLARMLAQASECPEMDDLQSASETAAGWLLPAVCQHYERKNERWRLLVAIQTMFKTSTPPLAYRQIATWKVPGVVCAYFDGMLDDAMAKERPIRSLVGVDQKAPDWKDETLIVHLRGVLSDGDSLILTERDEEQLLDRMSTLSPQVIDLSRKTMGRSLLYLGVSPRDPVVRRLTRALRGNARTQGPIYFVSPDRISGRAYWDEYGVRWLQMRLDDFIAAVTDTLAADRPS